jgi:transglutaminase-like putative cysteine protease
MRNVVCSATPAATQVKMEFEIILDYTISSAADFIFNIHAAKTPHQTVVSESLNIDRPVTTSLQVDETSGNRWLRLQASPGPLRLHYNAAVTLAHVVTQPAQIEEVPIANLPPAVLPYLRASRYCQSDRLLRMAFYEFGHLQPGYMRVQAIQEWVRKRVSFRPQTSDITTSAMDTLVEQVGVCRDYAHLMIALCRALNIPARFTTGIDYGADPALGPIDFHAYVEVFLSGRWYIFDPSGLAMPMGFVRLGTGRDAADVAFATIFGSVRTGIPTIVVRACADTEHNCILPYHTENLLSTAA